MNEDIRKENHVTAALLVHNERILIARRGNSEKLAGKWEFPGGKVESGETPEACLEREMNEEFGIVVRVRDHFSDSFYTYDHARIKLSAYWVYWIEGVPSLTVHDKLAWLRIADLPMYDLAPADLPLVQRLTENEKLREER